MTPRAFAITVVRTLREAGHEALWAGGCVRDELLGLVPADYDVATDARPERVQSLFRRTLAVGAAFGVVDVVGPRVDGKHLNVQVATFRSDGTYSDGRRPDSVTYGTAEADAQRRDFTVNGLFFDPLDDRLIDYVGGRADLGRKLLRAIGNPTDRFTEDKLRILRAVRMATRFDFAVDPATLAAGRALAPEIKAVSAERIGEELRKLLAHSRRARGVALLQEFGLVEPILPELMGTISNEVVAALPASAGFPLAFAALLLPAADSAKVICHRLRLSNDEAKHVGFLLTHRDALARAPSLAKSRLYPLLAHRFAGDLLALHEANGLIDGAAYARGVLANTSRDVLDPPPLITGDDLRKAGHRPGPAFKGVLERIRDGQLDGELNSFEEALGAAQAALR
jgi:tRNA nucleotidyltransferase/poly(A) polymerase